MYIIQEPNGHALDVVQTLWSVYTSSFPACERRSFAAYARICAEDPRFVPASLIYGGQIIGLLWFWKIQDFVYLEHFALADHMRNRGLGGHYMDQFLKKQPRVILEVEPPNTPLTSRRVAFYQRHGMTLSKLAYINPGYGAIDTPYPLRLMTYPTWDETQARAFLSLLFAEILKKPIQTHTICASSQPKS